MPERHREGRLQQPYYCDRPGLKIYLDGKVDGEGNDVKHSVVEKKVFGQTADDPDQSKEAELGQVLDLHVQHEANQPVEQERSQRHST